MTERWRGVYAGMMLLVAPAALAARPVPAAVPLTVTVTTARGEMRLPVRLDSAAGPAISGEGLVRALSGGVLTNLPWVEVTLARQSFRFLLGAPILSFNDRLQPLAGWAFRSRDSVFLPLQFVSEVLPEVLSERYEWDPATARLRETAPPTPPVTAASPPPRGERRLPNGLLPGHVVTVDAGHGGIDPGNPGIYFPRGMNEKHVTLQVALLLRQELKQRGIQVVMTRTTDTLIGLLDRGRFCTEACDLFVSLHVDALPTSARRKYGEIDGFHTIIIGEQNTEEADRIARMENDALRFEGDTGTESGEGLDFILKNLQLNEYLRESARAAELVQSEVGKIHTGTNRGVKQSRVLAVLNTARRPAILIEMGFSTNPRDARLLTSRKSQEAMASAIADAIVQYLLEYERKAGLGQSGGKGR
ncbi:MAG TPA: N-acetylmuramoyl-L-alanine amidase [Gemmatimonadales bacterium]|nr:N-acetylmuramoyl-L-alanine amidase [Gemmatimonadales bacterium]